MRTTAFALALTLSTPAIARAQAPIEIIGRAGAVRVPDDAGVEAPSGPRDCAAETWTFEVALPNATINPPSVWASAGFSCSLGERAMPNATCFELCGVSRNVCAGSLAAGSSRYRFTIPTRWLVDPAGGQCLPVSGRRAVFLVVDGEVVALSPRRVRFDLLPPAPPRDVDVTNYEDRVEARWSYGASGTAASDAGTIDTGVIDSGSDAGDAGDAGDPTDVVDAGARSSANGGEESVARFHVLCDPPEGSVASDGGASCGTGAFSTVDLTRDDVIARYRCAPEVASNARVATLTTARLGRRYQVAVVAEDLAGNRSTAALAARCASAEPVSDFWESYRAAGGAATPGLCAARPGPARGNSALALLALGSCALYRRARRRRS